jgi:hypothetical protein
LEGGRVGVELTHVVSFLFHHIGLRAAREAPEHIQLCSHL